MCFVKVFLESTLLLCRFAVATALFVLLFRHIFRVKHFLALVWHIFRVVLFFGRFQPSTVFAFNTIILCWLSLLPSALPFRRCSYRRLPPPSGFFFSRLNWCCLVSTLFLALVFNIFASFHHRAYAWFLGACVSFCRLLLSRLLPSLQGLLPFPASAFFSWYQMIWFYFHVIRQMANAVQCFVLLVAQVILPQLPAHRRFRLALFDVRFDVSLPLVQFFRLYYIWHRLVFISWRACPCSLASTVTFTQRLAPPR